MNMQSMDSHFNFRVSVEDKKLIETAARLLGFKSNTYARQRLVEVAKHDIEQMNQSHSMILDEEDWEQFVKVMENPVKINKNLQQAIKKFHNAFE